jgi:hypothetical protein
MTFPGVEGVIGPGWLTNTGFQVRQSRAGSYPGNSGFQTVLDSMGSNAPVRGVTAEAVNAREEAVDLPHAIEAENFEESPAQGGIDQFGVDKTDPSYFNDTAVDPIFYGQPGYTGM